MPIPFPQKLQQQQECRRAAVDLMEALDARLPLAEIVPENMRNPQMRVSLQSMLDVIERSMRFLIEYANEPVRSKYENIQAAHH